MNWVDEWFTEEWGGGGGYIGDMSTVDLEVSRDLGAYSLTFGAQNAFDDHPDKEKRGAILGWEYPEASPLGFNGAFLLLQAWNGLLRNLSKRKRVLYVPFFLS